MVRLPSPVAALVAKAESLEDLQPRVYACLLLTAGVLLVASGFGGVWKRKDDRDPV